MVCSCAPHAEWIWGSLVSQRHNTGKEGRVFNLGQLCGMYTGSWAFWFHHKELISVPSRKGSCSLWWQSLYVYGRQGQHQQCQPWPVKSHNYHCERWTRHSEGACWRDLLHIQHETAYAKAGEADLPMDGKKARDMGCIDSLDYSFNKFWRARPFENVLASKSLKVSAYWSRQRATGWAQKCALLQVTVA